MYKLILISYIILFSAVSIAQTKSTTKSPAKTVPAKKPASTSATTSKSQNKSVPGKKPVANTKVTFKIKGKLNGFKYHLIVLNKFRASELVLIDSVTTDAEGNFEFQKTIPEPCIAFIQHNKNAAVPIILENGVELNLTISPTDNSMDYSVEGIKAEKSVRLYNFIKTHSNLYASLGQIQQQVQGETDAVKMQEYQFEFSQKQKDMNMNIEAELLASGLEGYFVLFNFMEEQKPSDVKKVMDKMTPIEQKTVYYSDLKEFYDNHKLLDIGEVAPDFSLPTPDGDIIKLSDLRGKIVLIDFWASWCGPCRAEFPNVKRVYNRFGEKGFEILGVSLDKEESAWKNSIISLGLNWKHVSDLKYWSCAPAKMYKVSSIPATVLIDKDGKIVAKNLRGEELERKLEELFGE